MGDVLTYSEAKQKLSLKEKVGQFFMPAAFINDSEEEILSLENLIREQNVGGLCFFHSRASAATNFEGNPTQGREVNKVVHNVKSFEILKNLIQRYQSVSKYPLLIAIDAEWGLAMRVENTPQYPYAITLGAIEANSALVFEVGRNIAKDCKAAGIHWNLAPCVDINSNPANPVIGYRSFGEDKLKVVEKALAFVEGTQSEGVLTCIKHFPGHGDTATDSHLGLPLIGKSKEELTANELLPFQKLIDKGVDSVMVGHLSVPALANGENVSSSLSKEIIKGVLRKEMGFNGVIISDALNMHAVSKNHAEKGELEWLAFDSGNDMLCFAEHTYEGIRKIVAHATEKQIGESFARIWKLKEKAIRIQKPISSVNPTLVKSTGLNQEIAKNSLTLVSGNEALISEFLQQGFIGIYNSYIIENQFFNTIKECQQFNIGILGDSTTKNEENVLLALFPPQVKPRHRFGFSQEEITSINILMNTKNVVLYLFGNPYVLNHINYNKAKAVLIIYQSFEEFQKVAAAHFLGNFRAIGRLPVGL